MNEFITKLRHDHALILRAFSEVESYDINTSDARNKLIESRTLLMNHLSAENENLYGYLRTRASEDFKLKEMLDYFERDIELISKFAENFFEKYCQLCNTDSFPSDYKLLASSLKKRIKKEEDILFAEYSRQFEAEAIEPEPDAVQPVSVQSVSVQPVSDQSEPMSKSDAESTGASNDVAKVEVAVAETGVAESDEYDEDDDDDDVDY